MGELSLGSVVSCSVRRVIAPFDKLAYRIDEAADVCGLSRTTLYKLIAAKKLESAKVEGRRLILRDDLVAYLNSCKSESPAS